MEQIEWLTAGGLASLVDPVRVAEIIARGLVATEILCAARQLDDLCRQELAAATRDYCVG